MWIAGGVFVTANVLVLGSIAVVGKSVTDSLAAIKAVEARQASQVRSVANRLPSKFAVQFVTPRQDQSSRGTCWDFATIALLEWSYRANGVRHGWLQPDEYVALSEQAYGIEVMRLCTGPEDSPQQLACRVYGDYVSRVWNNTTEGGEAYDLYYLRDGLKNSVLPTAVCPYFKHGHEHECPGLSAALDQNPIQFNVTLTWPSSPTNWYACGGTDNNADLVSPTNATATVVYNKGIEDCLTDTTRMFAKTNVQTLDLKCSDATQCKVSDDVTYYVRNTTDWGDRMTLMCVWEHDAKTGSARDFCLIPMLEQNLAATFKYNGPFKCKMEFSY
ncbi:hypothetical protein DYB30_000410 [Aphanomyces astaci]|uniref:Peptidase C1A papain C-terminal domain-containing protein n=1 Tax=Aphanomyces astaci TaxID=112090 RepID=A0A397CUF2_APHAT|nr:hypothetical protein DYB30_000410 [Aphanomyces astaci]